MIQRLSSDLVTYIASINRTLVDPDAQVAVIAKINELVDRATSPQNVFNVRDYGAVGTGSADDSAAIRAAIAACAAAGGGVVYLPNGTYRVSRGASAVLAGCITLTSGITLRGQSRANTVLKLSPDQIGFTRIITLDHADDCAIETLTLDGNKTNQPTQEEHMAGVFAASCKRLVIRGVTAEYCVGDGIDIWQFCDDVLVEDSLALENNRSGIAINGGGQKRITVRKSQCVGNLAQQLDTEPPEVGFAGLVVEDCYLSHGGISTDYSLTLSGQSQTGQSSGIRVTNCTIEGCVYVVWAKDVVVSGCTITSRSADIQGPVVIDRRCENVLFEKNTITCNTSASTGGVLTAVMIEGTSDQDKPRSVMFRRNRVVVNTNLNGFYIPRPINVDLVENEIIAFSGCTRPGISAWATETATGAPQIEHLGFRGNEIVDFASGIVVGCVGGPSTIKDLVVVDNTVRKSVNASATAGFELDGGGAAQAAEIHGNRFVGIAVPFNGYPACPVLVSGQPGMNAVYWNRP